MGIVWIPFLICSSSSEQLNHCKTDFLHAALSMAQKCLSKVGCFSKPDKDYIIKNFTRHFLSKNKFFDKEIHWLGVKVMNDFPPGSYTIKESLRHSTEVQAILSLQYVKV